MGEETGMRVGLSSQDCVWVGVFECVHACSNEELRYLWVVTSGRACVQDGWSCLLAACQEGHLDVAKYLCEVGGERLLTLTANVSTVSSPGQMYVCGSSVQPRRELDCVRGLWVR